MEPNATIVGYHLNSWDVTTTSDMPHRRFQQSGTADLTIRCDGWANILIEMKEVAVSEWVGLHLGDRVRVDITLRPQD